MSLVQTACWHLRSCSCHYKNISVKLGVLLVVLIKTAVFSDATPCRLVCRYRYLQEACCLHLQGSPRRVTTMEAAKSCKTFVPVYQSVQWHPRSVECLAPCFVHKESSLHDDKWICSSELFLEMRLLQTLITL